MDHPRSVFVTGASGFIGSALAEHYRRAGATVRGVDRVADPRLGVVAGDVSAEGDWQKAVEGAELVIRHGGAGLVPGRRAAVLGGSTSSARGG